MKRILLALAVLAAASCSNSPRDGELITISRETLTDKVMGGWAGQCIGVSLGRPFEFRFACPINEGIPVKWDENTMADCFPSFDDDLYMDITFVDVYERLGLDAPVDSLAMAFANAKYYLWHGNQAARYNILNGIMPPLSGKAEYNHHCDDIDFQIESDHCGLMSPGLPKFAAHFADKSGHIMSSGDGFYGGVYFSTMYSLAYISDDIDFVTSEALKAIPAESKYRQAMEDIIGWHKQYPDCWQQTWALVEKKYGNDVGCPDGALAPFNIDALMNSAFVLMGLLYGEKDFAKTMDVALRCGHDTDCNASSAAGILGVILGYSNIPEVYIKGLEKAADMNFDYTSYSFNTSWKVSLSHALKVVEMAGGKVDENQVSFEYESPVAVPLEQNWLDLRPYEKTYLRASLLNNPVAVFEGNGVYATYYFVKDGVSAPMLNDCDYVAEVEVYLDGEYRKTVMLPIKYHDRALDLYYNHGLEYGEHELSFKLLNPVPDVDVRFDYFVNYR